MDPLPPAPPVSTPPVSPQPQPVIQSSQSKSKVWPWILGGISLLGVGVVIGVFLGKQLYSIPQPVTTPLPPEASAKEGDPTATWKIYTTRKFSLRYPNYWQIELFGHSPDMYTLQPSKDFVPESQKKGVVVSISRHCLNTQCLTVLSLEEMVSQINAKIVNQTIADGVKAYKVSLPDEKFAYIFINGQDFFEISTDKYFTELDQILSTFRFVGQ